MSLNQRGSTLVQALVGTAILVTLVSAVATLFSQVSKQTQVQEKLKDINLLHQKITTLLSQRTTCQATLLAAYNGGATADTPAARANISLANTAVNAIFDEALSVSYRPSAALQVLPEILLTDIRVQDSAFIPAIRNLPGQRFFHFAITYQLGNSTFTSFNHSLQKLIPMFVVFDDPTTVAIENSFQYCITKGLAGVDREYMNAFQPEVLANNSHYTGGNYPPSAPAPTRAAVVPPPFGQIVPTTADPVDLRGFVIQSWLQVEPDPNINLAIPANYTRTGYVYAQHFALISDQKEKKNIETIQNPLELIQNFKAYEYNFKDNPQKEIGLLAQDIEKISPLVRERPDGVKTVNYNGVIGLQIEAIKALKKEQKELNKKLDQLQSDLIQINSDL